MSSRIEREREFHNRRFAENPQRSAALQSLSQGITLDALAVAYETMRCHCPGAKVLDYGCAEGESSRIFSRYGAASVDGIDISDVAIRHARKHAREANLSNVTFQKMDAEHLDFAANEFDLVCGFGILHHLDLDSSYAELSRVLRPNGRAIFLEPLGHNPGINAFRKLTPSLRTPDEHPFKMRDIKLAKKYFGRVSVNYVNLTTLFTVPFSSLPVAATTRRRLHSVDRSIFQLLPFMRRFAWNVVLEMSEPRSSVKLREAVDSDACVAKATA